MEAQPQRVAERVLSAFSAVGVAGFAAWITYGSLLLLGAALECSSPGDPGDVAVTLMLSACVTAATVASWLGVLSLLLVAAGRRGLSTPTWMFVPLALAVLSMPCVAVASAQQPPHKAACGPLES